MLDALKTRLQPWLAERLNARDLVVQTFEPLGGGSIQENWRLRCMSPDGVAREFVLRKDAPATIASSRTRREEYAIMEAAHEAGVLTPEPVGFCADADVIGAPLAVMSMVPGVGLGPRIVKDRSAATARNSPSGSGGARQDSCGAAPTRSARLPRSPARKPRARRDKDLARDPRRAR